MNRSAILALAIVFSSVLIVSGTNICNNAPCEPQINASLGKEFDISLESNPSTGFEWWTKFDPDYLSLLNSTFVSGNEISGLVGVPGNDVFTFNARSAGNTEVIMLLLKPWENGTITERKIFPINIMSAAAAPKQAIVLSKGVSPEPITISKNTFQSSGGTATNTISNGQTTTTSHGTSSNYFTNESVMETPSQVVSQSAPTRSDLSSLSKPSI
ncbi:MAG: protease inhibitor I42 family protein [Methanotrichaceae archaeon]|nr:protease inhibitor I42 family protein [Methanotrichaceae archaeon]